MSEEWDELPEGWRWAELAQVAEIGAAQVLPKRQPDTLFNYVALENIEQGTGRLIDFTPTRGAEIASNKYNFTPEHVLYGKLRPYLQKALIPDFEGISVTDLLPLKPNPELLDRRFLWRWLLSYDVLEYVTARQTGVKMPRLRTGDLEAMPVPLPSLSEQGRIVERIERLLAESRTAREALDKVPALLKRFRQSMLAKAFRGELTERDPGDEPAAVLLERIREERRRKWEDQSSSSITGSSAVALRTMGDSATVARTLKGKKAKYAEPEPPDTSDLPELPEGWKWVSVEQLANVATGATPLRSKKSYYVGGKIPWITSGSLNELFVTRANEFVTELALKETNVKIFQKGTLLVAMYGEGQTRGRVSELAIEATTNQACAAIVLEGLAKDIRQWIKFFFLKNYEDIRLLSSGGVQPNLNLSMIKHTYLPLPPLAEQRRIVAKIESLFARAKAIERAVGIARRRAEKVDQAVLARAFRGEL